MSEERKDGGPAAPGSTVISSADVQDTDAAQARGHDADPGPMVEQRVAALAPSGGAKRPGRTDDAGKTAPAAGRPPEGHPPGFIRRLRDVAGEHPGAASVAAILLLLLLVGAVGGTGLAVWALDKEAESRKAEREAVEKSKKAEEAADAAKGKLQQVDAARKGALDELRRARAAEAAARQSEEETRAILEFIRRNLLLAGRAGRPADGRLLGRRSGQGHDAPPGGGSGRVAGRRGVRRPAPRRSRRPRDAGPGRPECGRTGAGGEAVRARAWPCGRPCKEATTPTRPRAATSSPSRTGSPAARPRPAACSTQDPDSPAHAAALAARGAMLLLESKPAEAELKLRECLMIRRKIQPGDWTTFETESMLGEALLGSEEIRRGRADCCCRATRACNNAQDSIPPQDKPRLTRALERLVKLYEAWGKPDKAMRWRQELEAAKATKKS